MSTARAANPDPYSPPDQDSGVRRRPTAQDDLPDLTHLARPAEPPPPPPDRARPGRVEERVDLDALLLTYRPRLFEQRSYFPPVPGIPPVLTLPPEARAPLPIDAARALVIAAGVIGGALLAMV